MIDIKITSETLNLSECVEKVMWPQAGGIDVFIGTVRSHTKNRKVVRLEFEAYEKMALSEMQKITDEMMKRWPLHKILIHHRVGILQVGEVPVIIAVSASHRDAAFEACRYAIDTLKQTVPIWKKEVFEDGEEWVAAHP
ncbi:MAG TPA: molybdenum cofactor biosynthesis protein MoaE [Flavisolibacter sp.]|nr:molybdenum cofactor biosynthesis protein MoaE [Flavisolibacter sp.]